MRESCFTCRFSGAGVCKRNAPTLGADGSARFPPEPGWCGDYRENPEHPMVKAESDPGPTKYATCCREGCTRLWLRGTRRYYWLAGSRPSHIPAWWDSGCDRCREAFRSERRVEEELQDALFAAQ